MVTIFYRHYPGIINKTPMLHWGQATMSMALAQLLMSIKAAESSDRPRCEVPKGSIRQVPGSGEIDVSRSVEQV